MNAVRSAVAAALIAAIGSMALWWATDQGSAFTSETARRRDIAAAPRLLPDVVLHDQTGAAIALADYRNTPLVVEFIYASCPDICLALGSAFERLDAALPKNMRLLSISFDPRDNTERLGWFADRHRAHAPRWRVASIGKESARQSLLQRAGVVVIPDGMGGYVHNAGLYLIDMDGRLTRVFDPDDIEGLRAALSGNAT